MIATSWIDQVADQAVCEVASRLGYEVRKTPSAHHCKCPACGAERRHSKSRDKRGAVGMPLNAGGWRCFQCGEGGDAIDFASYHIGGRRFRDLSSDRRSEVREFFVGRDGSVGSGVFQAPPRLRNNEAPVAFEHAAVATPPMHELEAFWGDCVPVDKDAAARAYLAHRGILGIDRLVEHDCVRALPLNSWCPEWAGMGSRGWAESEHRLIVPLYDYLGEFRSVLARSIELNPPKGKKSLGTRGYGRAGLVMAATYGREMLKAGPLPSFHRLENFRLTVLEGEIDMLRAVSEGGDAVFEEDYRPAAFRGVLGVFAGSFGRDIASRVPDGSHVVISTDADDQGDEYAEKIDKALSERVTRSRVRQPKD